MNSLTLRRFCRTVSMLPALLILAGISLSQTPTESTSTGFPPLDQWKAAVVAGDRATLRSLYSTDPPARIEAKGTTTDAEADIGFWLGLKVRSIKIEIVRLKDRPDAEGVIFKAEVGIGLPNGQTVDITDAQGWRKQGGHWRIVGVERTDAPQLAQPSDMKKNLYPADADAHAEFKEAEEKAAAGHKRVLLVFGANWCYDCHVLDLAFHRPDFASVMANYEVVHVDLGDDGKKNGDVVKQFDASLDKGIPVLAVAESDGRVVFGQKNGEFEDARSLTPEALLEFLNKYKPDAR